MRLLIKINLIKVRSKMMSKSTSSIFYLFPTVVIITLASGLANARSFSERKVQSSSEKTSIIGGLYVQENKNPCGIILERSQNSVSLETSNLDSLAAENIRNVFARNNIQECSFTEHQREDIEFSISMVTGGSIQVAGWGSAVLDVLKGIALGGVVGCMLGSSLGLMVNDDVERELDNKGYYVFLGGMLPTGLAAFYGTDKMFGKQMRRRTPGVMTKTGTIILLFSGIAGFEAMFGCGDVVKDLEF